MGRRRKVVLEETNFIHEPEVTLESGHVISQGDLIKIQGQHGMKFKFHSLVTNKTTGVQWIDCFEVYRMSPGVWRSFYPEQIKRIPKKRGRRKAIVN
jgi:hypothetical protein